MERFEKRIMRESRCEFRSFTGIGRGTFVELLHFHKDFVKISRKKGPAGKHFGVFSPTIKTTF